MLVTFVNFEKKNETIATAIIKDGEALPRKGELVKIDDMITYKVIDVRHTIFSLNNPNLTGDIAISVQEQYNGGLWP